MLTMPVLIWMLCLAGEMTALQQRCAQLEKDLKDKSLLESQVARLEREKVRMTSHFNKMKAEKNTAVEYVHGSHAELTLAKQEIERLHAELRAAELTAERESTAANQLRRQLNRAEETQKGKYSFQTTRPFVFVKPSKPSSIPCDRSGVGPSFQERGAIIGENAAGTAECRS
jgi:biopolymer transport protein ExbB/TolQ